MKKKVLKLTLLLLTVVLVFSSCLGDTENKIEVTKDYVCVIDPYGQANGFARSVGYVYAPEFQQFEKGTTLAVGYKIIGSQNSNIPTLQEVKIVERYPAASQAPLRWGMAAPGETEKEIYPVSLGVVGEGWSPYPWFLDRWMFSPYFSVEDETKITATFYYDPQRQEESNGELIKDRIVLDVRFVSSVTDPVNPINKEYKIVANFDGIRTNIASLPNFSGSKPFSSGGTPVNVKFRYRLLTKDGGYEEKVLGSSTDYQIVMYTED